MLTNSDLKQILDALARYGKKDSQLDTVPIDLEHPEGTFTTNDYLSIVQDGKNKTIKIKNLEKVFLLTFLTDEDFREALKGRIPGEMLENASVTTEKLADGSITTIKLGDSSVTNAKLSDNAVTSSKLADNSVTTSKIVDESVTTSKLNTNAVTTNKLADGSVTTDKIANGAVTSSKIADNSLSGANFGNNTIEGTKIKDNSIPGSKLADGAIESIDIKDGTLSGSKLADNSVTGAKLQDSVITGMKIADNSIPGSKIADSTIQNLNIANGSIGGSKLVDNAITTDKIANGAINSAKLTNDAITENKIADDSVTTNKIADRAVTNSKLANNSVTSDKIADNSVTYNMITDYAVTENKLDSGSVTASKIAPNAVTTTKLGDNAITSDKIVDGSITEQKLADNSVTTDKINTDAVTNVKIADNAVTESKIATNAITTAKIADSSVTTVKIADNTVTTIKLADGAVTEDKLADGAVTTAKLADGLISEIQNITDATPTEDSVKPVQSGGVKTAIDNVAFSTNEKVKDVGIDNEPTAGSENLVKSRGVAELVDTTHLVNPTEKSLAKAEDAMQLKVKLDGITAKETKGNTELDYNGYIVCKTSGKITEKTFRYDGSVHTLFIPISEGAKRVRFLGRNVNSTSFSSGYCFINALNQEDIETNILVQNGEEPKDISNYIVNVNPWPNVGNNNNVEIIANIPSDATYFCAVYGTGNIKKDNFYCYLQSGETIKDLVPEIVPTVIDGGNGVVNADAIKDLAVDFYPFKTFHYRGGSNFKQRYISSTSLKWASSTTYRSYVVSLKNIKFIRVVANENYVTKIAFLKDDISTVGETPNFSDNTSLVTMHTNSEKFFQVPSDANYLYVYTGTVSEGFPNLPAIIEKSEKYTTFSEEEDMNSKIYSLMEEIEITLPSSDLGYIVTLNRTNYPWFGQWYQAQRHFEIPVSEKDKYIKIVGNETNSTSYSFFTAHSVYPVTSGAIPNYADGIDQAFILPANETVICKIPDGTKYIYIRGGQSVDNLNYQPQYVAVLRFPEKEDPYDILSLNPDIEVTPKMLALQKGSGGLSSTNGIKPNTFMFSHITDCHGGTTAGINSVSNRTWERFLKFSNHWKTKGFIDDIVDTGDIVGNVFANSIQWRTNADNVLTVIGNHDTATISSEIYDWTAKAGKESYDKYLSPYIQNWNVTQPGNADTEGYCYYYKDYVRTSNDNTIKLRCVFVDVMGWDSNNVQKNWLDNVLEDARTSGFVVCIFTHFVPIRTRPLSCSFTSKTLSISTEDFPYHGYNTYCKQLCACVRTFQDNGGIFSCYIAGHRHIVGIAQVYGNVTIDDITYDFNDETKPQIVVYGSAGYVNMGNLNDYIKQANTKNEDNFQIVAIDPYRGIDDDISSSSFRIKVLKIGCNYNRHMQNADVVNITYCPYPLLDPTNQNYRIGTIVNKDNVLYKFVKPVYNDGVLDWDNSVVEVTNRIISE